jgi:hypothetical protein
VLGQVAVEAVVGVADVRDGGVAPPGEVVRGEDDVGAGGRRAGEGRVEEGEVEVGGEFVAEGD